MTKIRVTIETEVDELVYDALVRAYNMLQQAEVEKILIIHNKRMLILKEA